MLLRDVTIEQLTSHESVSSFSCSATDALVAPLRCTMSNIDAENDEEKQAFLPTSSQREGQVVVNQRRHNAWSCLRLALEVLMACSIALLVLQPVVHGRGSSPVPSCRFLLLIQNDRIMLIRDA